VVVALVVAVAEAEEAL